MEPFDIQLVTEGGWKEWAEVFPSKEGLLIGFQGKLFHFIEMSLENKRIIIKSQIKLINVKAI